MAVDSQYDGQYGGEAARLPVSLHPAFPAIVALWFAALFGIGSLVLPAVLLDRVVSATGLASLLPAAAPPLGMTARLILAIAGALAGAALGVALARRIAGAHAPKGESRAAKLAAASRRPISVHDELGDAIELGAVTNGESLPISHRHALAISEDDRPSDFLYRAPLPGEDPDALAPFAAAPIVSAVLDDEPFELSEVAQEDDEDSEMTGNPESPSPWPSHQHYPRGLEPLPFAAPSLARRAADDAEAMPEPEPESEPELQLKAVTVAEAAEVPADWQSAPLEGLGLVQLVQRLGATIERRRQVMASAAALPPAPPVAFAEADLEPAAPEEAVQAMAAFFGSAPAAKPEPEASEQVAPTAAPRSEFVRVEEPEEEADLAEPAVVFPGQEAPAPGSRWLDPPGKHVLSKAKGAAEPVAAAPRIPADADAALRAALATLQRMSGAA